MNQRAKEEGKALRTRCPTRCIITLEITHGTLVVSCLPLPASFFVFRLGPLSSYARASGRQVR